MKVVYIRTYEMLTTSEEDRRDMNWSGKKHGDSGSDDIDDESTYDSF